MNKYIITGLLMLSSANISAATVFNQSATVGQTDYFSFSFGGGALDIDIYANGLGASGTGPYGIQDTYIGLFEDNGSAEGALTGSLLGFNDNEFSAGTGDGSTSFLDSYLSFASLSAGNYVLAVDRFADQISEADLRDGATGNIGDGGDFTEYQITFSSDVTPSPVPLPASAWLFVSAIAGLFATKKAKLKQVA